MVASMVAISLSSLTDRLRANILNVASGLRPFPLQVGRMKNKLIVALTLAAWLTACGRNDARSSKNQQEYEVVQEGAASGVTSTIQGPGETVPPITNTNADTTTAFAFNPGTVTSTTPAPGTVAGTLPPPMPPPMPAATPPPPMTSSTRPAPVVAQPRPQPAPPPTQTEPPPEPTEPPKQTDTAAPPPPATDTTATEPAEEPTQTDTTATPPPPPPG
jgi:hypothetical protein